MPAMVELLLNGFAFVGWLATIALGLFVVVSLHVLLFPPRPFRTGNQREKN